MTGKRVENEETFAWASWLLKFQEVDKTSLETYEADLGSGNFVQGANRTILQWDAQSRTCDEVRATYDPALFTDYAIASAGVLKGLPADGVRYRYRSPNSGWCFFANDYQGALDELERVHVHDILQQNPTLGRMLALPQGYRFEGTFPGARIWYDEEAGTQEPA